MSINRSIATGTPLYAANSTVSVTDSTLRGQDSYSVSVASSGIFAWSSSRITLSRTNVYGGSGARGMFINEEPEPAFAMTGGTLTVTGDVGTTIRAGQVGGVQTPTSAIEGSGVSLVVDPRVTLQSAYGAPPVAAGLALATVPVASMSADASFAAGTLSIDLLALSGDVAQIYASLPFGPVAAPPPFAGQIWVNFGAVVVLGTFAIPASEHVSFSFPLSPDPVLQGLPLTFQALVLTPGVAFRFSNAATPILN